MTATGNTTAPAGRRDETVGEERHRLTAREGLAALSLLDRVIRNGTGNVVICRMRFRPTTWPAS